MREELAFDLESVSRIKQLEDKQLSWEPGTSFYILGLTEHIPELFDKANRELPPEEEWSSDYLKSLHALDTFWDPFHDEHEGRSFSISPRRDGKNLYRENRFWEPGDFSQCDHHIKIEVSENGFAEGTIKNYQKQPSSYQRQLRSLPKYSTSPGPFLVEIGYLVGIRSDSALPDDIYTSMSRRLEHAGGFSVYSNHVRIQPYGSIDSDFVGFEYRRLKNAGRYYFSSRRMFGGVFLPPMEEPKLREKAGSKSIIKNGPSRGLKFWLEDLFIDLADTHFGSKAERPDKEENERRKKNKTQAEERLKLQKKEFLNQVSKAQKSFEPFEKTVLRQIANIKQLIGSEINARSTRNLPQEFGRRGGEPQESTERAFCQPRRTSCWGGSHRLYDQPCRLLYLEALKSSQLVGKASFSLCPQARGGSKRRRSRQEHLNWLQEKFDSVGTIYSMKVAELVEPLKAQQQTFKTKVDALAADNIESLKEVFKNQMGGLTPKHVADDLTEKSSTKLERALQIVETHYQEFTKRHITEIAEEIQHLLEGSSSIVLVQEYAAEINRLKDREAFLIEMAQLGIITEAASHEHEHHVEVVRTKIAQLRKSLSGSERDRLAQLEASFDIIDSRIRMFDPLIRRKRSANA